LFGDYFDDVINDFVKAKARKILGILRTLRDSFTVCVILNQFVGSKSKKYSFGTRDLHMVLRTRLPHIEIRHWVSQ